MCALTTIITIILIVCFLKERVTILSVYKYFISVLDEE